jgi:hypothetical protein
MMEFQTMAQMNKIKGVIVMTGLLGGLALAGVPAFAQMAAPATPPAAPGGGMMMPGMPNAQGGMAMSPDMQQNMSGMMQKMSKMMDDCNGMMEKMQKKTDLNTPSTLKNKG